MNKFIKQLLCKHDWETIGKPFIVDAGRTKMCKAHCIKCGKETYYDIFCPYFSKKVKKNDNI